MKGVHHTDRDEEFRSKTAITIRDLIFDDASHNMQAAMCASPEECFGFAAEWIKRRKGLEHNKQLFKE